MTTSEQILTEYYEAHRTEICAFIARRIQHPYLAEDLAQDVFVRLWNIRQTICSETIRALIYTVASNIALDHCRRCRSRLTYEQYQLYAGEVKSDITTSEVMADDLLANEMRIVSRLPEKRRKVYMLNRYDDMSVDDIAATMNISQRTAETHLFIGRKTVREELRKCM